MYKTFFFNIFIENWNFIQIFEDYLLIFKIENCRVVENIFPERISHDLWKFIIFKKLIRSNNKEKLYNKKHY